MGSLSDKKHLKAAFHSHLGPEILAALEDPRVNEIMGNPDGELWLQRQGEPMFFSGTTLSASAREVIVSQVATLIGTTADWDHAMVEGEFPFGPHRFQGFLPPVSREPAFVIRKHLPEPLSLDDYVFKGILQPWQAEYLRLAVYEGQMLLLSGAPKSGKTTLLAALLDTLNDVAIEGWVRTLLIEDPREIACTLPNTLALSCSKPYNLSDLVRASLRANPTRLVVGEVRGAEALQMLEAGNLGIRGGLATLHANGVHDIFYRLSLMVQKAGMILPRGIFAGAVNVLAHITYEEGVRKLTEIACVVPDKEDFTIVPVTEEDLQ